MISDCFKFLLILSLQSIETSFAIINCPNGWLDAQDFNLGCLMFDGNKSMAWNEAQNFCQKLDSNSHLVEIFSDDQQEFMIFNAIEYEEFSGNARNWWIGLTDEESENEWYWTKSNQKADFTSWGTG